MSQCDTAILYKTYICIHEVYVQCVVSNISKFSHFPAFTILYVVPIAYNVYGAEICHRMHAWHCVQLEQTIQLMQGMQSLPPVRPPTTHLPSKNKATPLLEERKQWAVTAYWINVPQGINTIKRRSLFYLFFLSWVSSHLLHYHFSPSSGITRSSAVSPKSTQKGCSFLSMSLAWRKSIPMG